MHGKHNRETVKLHYRSVLQRRNLFGILLFKFRIKMKLKIINAYFLDNW